MTTSHPANGTSRPNPKAGATKRRLSSLDLYNLAIAERADLAAKLDTVDAELARWGKLLAEIDQAFCRACGARVEASAPVVDPKGGFRVRRRCKGINGAKCSSKWWSPAEPKEASR